MISKKTVAGAGLTATMGLAAGALLIPSGSAGQTYTQPPTYTQPGTTTTTTTTVPVPQTARDLTPAEQAALIANMINALVQELGITADDVTVVNFNGGALVFPRILDANRAALRDDDGLVLGRFGCFRGAGCDTGVNMKFRMGGKTFFNKKTVELLQVGQQRTVRVKVTSNQRGLLARSTRVRPAFSLRLRDPRNTGILGNAKRTARIDLP